MYGVCLCIYSVCMCVQCISSFLLLFLAHEPVVLKKVNLPMQNHIGRLKNIYLKKCKEACYMYSGCNAALYDKKAKVCDLSNGNQLNEELKPNSIWDLYILYPC